jgi:nicotinamide mononucleotide adenylyltransferase
VPSISRISAHTKVSVDELTAIERRVTIKRELAARKLKSQLHLQASVRTVQKYLNILGWRKKMTKFCQIVSSKNRMERIIFAKLCSATNYNFHTTIFIDESSIYAT